MSPARHALSMEIKSSTPSEPNSTTPERIETHLQLLLVHPIQPKLRSRPSHLLYPTSPLISSHHKRFNLPLRLLYVRFSSSKEQGTIEIKNISSHSILTPNATAADRTEPSTPTNVSPLLNESFSGYQVHFVSPTNSISQLLCST